MTYSEISGPDFNPYFQSHHQAGHEIEAGIHSSAELESIAGSGFHPERIEGGLEVNEGVLLLGGLRRVHYRSPDWVVRATEMRPETVE